MADLRARRIARERALLQRLAADNPHIFSALESSPDDELRFQMEACGTHRSVRIVFPRFFPSVPMDAYVAPPAVHPNIDPETGFVCLWTRTSALHTSLEAVRRLRLILAWRSFNLDADHVMQPAAAERARSGDFEKGELEEMTPPRDLLLEATRQAPRPRRRRLSD